MLRTMQQHFIYNKNGKGYYGRVQSKGGLGRISIIGILLDIQNQMLNYNLTDIMNHDNDDFYNKLYAIQPFKETQSPKSSASKSSQPPDPLPEPLHHHFSNIPDPTHFLDAVTPLRKIHSEQPSIAEVQIGQSNRKTMTSISSTIDILFSKIEKIKEEFSFALPKIETGFQNISQWSTETVQANIQGGTESNGDKENQPPTEEKLQKIQSKIEAMMSKLQKLKPLEEHNQNCFKVNAYSSKKKTPEGDRQCNIFESWAPENVKQQPDLKIRDFTLGKCMGSGKFGDVYMSQHKATGFLCAIKKILKSTIQQYSMIDQLINQLRIHYSLCHPNIVQLYGHFQDEYHIFLLMELAPNGCLIDRLNMPQPKVSQMIDQVTDALVYTHQRKVIHRDIKPENIVLALDVPKLCDFGWAAVVAGNQMHQTFCGTLDYVSPEMKDLGEYNQSIDLWSIGVLTFELLAGFPPFKHEISNWKLKGSKRKIRWSWEVLYPPEIGNDAKSFIEGLLQVDPEQRASLSECKRHMFIKAYSYKQAAGCPEEFTQLFQ